MTYICIARSKLPSKSCSYESLLGNLQDFNDVVKVVTSRTLLDCSPTRGSTATYRSLGNCIGRPAISEASKWRDKLQSTGACKKDSER